MTEDRPGNIHHTGDSDFNALQKRIGTKRYRMGFYQAVEDDDGQFVDYHNFCAAIRTKVSTIHHNDQLWKALIVLARQMDRERIDALQDMYPDLVSDLEAAYERSRDQWEHYAPKGMG